MSLITIAQLKEHTETDLSDSALQRIIDSQEAEITSKYGPHDTQIQVFEPKFKKVLYPYRKVSSITQIIERIGDTDTTLAADDYEVTADGARIDRLGTGTNPATYWGDRITVTYVPVGESAKRVQVLIDLCKLTIAYTAIDEESVGDYKSKTKRYHKERLEILTTLAGRGYA